MITESGFWTIVESTGFNKHKDYKIARKYISRYFNQKDADVLRKKSKEFQAILEVKIRHIEVNLGDDGMWDLLSTVVGLGREVYYDICANPSKILNIDRVENFDYCFTVETEGVEDVVVETLQ